jgi:methylaspartate ammonia-lyase
MSDKRTDPFEVFQISRELLTAEQRLLPSTRVFEQLAETIRTITQANMAYSQALMRANAALMAALMARPGDPAPDDERPSEAAHRPDRAAP